MTGASIETTLELWASSLREVKAAYAGCSRSSGCRVGEPVSGRLAG